MRLNQHALRSEVYFFLSTRVRSNKGILTIGLFDQEGVLNALQLEHFHRFEAVAPAHGCEGQRSAVAGRRGTWRRLLGGRGSRGKASISNYKRHCRSEENRA